MTAGLGMPGVELTQLDTHDDSRGTFAEILRASDFDTRFVQSNYSASRAGVLRGLHYHRNQADLWLVVSGRAQVGLADLRTRSEAPRSTALTLEAGTPTTLYIPPGVAHGFLALTDLVLIYWVTEYYDASDEHGVAWDDPTLAVAWETDSPILSDRDSANPKLQWDEIPSF